MNMNEASFNVKDVTEASILGSNTAEFFNKTAGKAGIAGSGMLKLSRDPENFAAFSAALSAGIQDEGRRMLVNSIKMQVSRLKSAARQTFKDTGQLLEVPSYSWKKNEGLVINWLVFVPEKADTKAAAKAETAAETAATETAETAETATETAEPTELEKVTAERDDLRNQLAAAQLRIQELETELSAVRRPSRKRA
jgi:hypothetical protein